MDSNLGYHLLPTRLQEQQKRSIIISHHPKKPLAKMDDDCIDSDGEDVPISVSEEEETQMESEDEEKDSKAAPAPTIEGGTLRVSAHR